MARSTYALSSLFLLGLLTACEKDAEEIHDDLVNAPHANTTLTMSMSFTRNGAAFDPSVPFTDANGRTIRIDGLKFFMSQPWFEDDNGDTVANFPSKYLLFDLASAGSIQTIGEVDAHLHALHCGLGVDSATNHLDPTTLGAPLNDPTMWWGWAGFHKFLSLSGKFDSNSNNAIDNGDQDFNYDCGFDTLYTPLEVHVHTDADMGGSVVVALSLNIDTLMAGMNVAAQPQVHVLNDISAGLMQRLAAGITHVE
jgi:hypothetical protein